MAKRATDLELRKLKRLYRKGYSVLEISYHLDRSEEFVKIHIKNIKQSRKKVNKIVGE